MGIKKYFTIPRSRQYADPAITFWQHDVLHHPPPQFQFSL
jgi:hypothetical protein